MVENTDGRKEQREIILKAATALFSRLGFKKATVSDIAHATGLKKPSIYYYFSSKNEIISAVVRRESRELVSVMEAAAAAEDATPDKLKAFILARYQAIGAKRSSVSISNDELIETGPLLRNARNETVELEIAALSRILEGAIAKGEIALDDPTLFARIAIASMNGIDEGVWLYGLEDQIESGVHLMVNIVYRGLRKEQKK